MIEKVVEIWNSESAWTLAGAVVVATQVVVGWTKTKVDDKWLKKIVQWVSVVTPRNATGTWKWPFTAPEGDGSDRK